LDFELVGFSCGRLAIHGTNRPESIGKVASYGCIRLFNQDITDLFERVDVGTQVGVMRLTGERARRATDPCLWSWLVRVPVCWLPWERERCPSLTPSPVPLRAAS
jgi:hypothetical protein